MVQEQTRGFVLRFPFLVIVSQKLAWPVTGKGNSWVPLPSLVNGGDTINKRQKVVLQEQLKAEKAVLKKLEKHICKIIL